MHWKAKPSISCARWPPNAPTRLCYFSGGKDSIVLLRLAEKAFRPGRFPFPLLHIDTGHNFPEVIEFRDRRAQQLGERLIVRSMEDSIRQGRVVLRSENQSRNAFQSVTLLDAIAEFRFDACIGGARRDEEKARAKERIFSFRDEFGQWDPEEPASGTVGSLQYPRPSWREYPCISHQQLDRARRMGIYCARRAGGAGNLFRPYRDVIRRGAGLLPLSHLSDLKEGEKVENLMVRFRTVGDMSCTCPVSPMPSVLARLSRKQQ